MKIETTPIKDLFIIAPTVFKDDRGYFFESYNENRFHSHELEHRYVQDNESFSSYGTVRGIHLQLGEFAQTKLVRVITGRVLDIAVDLRKGSPTYGQHYSIELSAKNKKQFLVPKGFGHGFSVLSETATFCYKCDQFYNKESESGIIYNDSTLGIDWGIPAEKIIINDKDKLLPSFNQFTEEVLSQ